MKGPAAPHPVGVLGGMGPAATLDFMAKVLRGAGAARDQDHVRLIVDDNPHVPDRNAATGGEGASPGPVLAAMAKGLEGAGARALAITCNSAHAFAGEVRAAVSIPLLDMIEETVKATLRTGAPRRVGVLAAAACLDAGLYQGAFAGVGVEVLTLDGSGRAGFQRLLYAIKAGSAGPAERAAAAGFAERLCGDGAEAIVSACTELPLVLAQSDVAAPLVDSTDALVARVIAFARTGA